MASKILASTNNNSLANRPGCNPDGSTGEMPASSAFEDHGEMLRSQLFPDEQKQVRTTTRLLVEFVGAADRCDFGGMSTASIA